MEIILSIYSWMKHHRRYILLYSILLFLFTSFLCILIFSFIYYDRHFSQNYIVYAKESTDNNFSTARRISCSSGTTVRLPAYDSLYFYLEGGKDRGITVQFNSSSGLQFHFYTERGGRLPISGHQKGKGVLFSLDKSCVKKNNRIFFKITNKTNNSRKCTLFVTARKQTISYTKKPKTTNKKNTTSHIPNAKKNVSKKRKTVSKPVTTVKKKYVISPNFLHCKTGEKIKLRLLDHKKIIKNSSVSWTSSNPKAAKINQGILTAKQQGISIILVYTEKVCSGSCLVRITD